jgi:hypothetical protein
VTPRSMPANKRRGTFFRMLPFWIVPQISS